MRFFRFCVQRPILGRASVKAVFALSERVPRGKRRRRFCKKHCPGQQENGRSENMTISECYEKLGGDYADVCTRLPSDRLVAKFIGRFLDDDSFDALCREMEAGDRGEAFRAAHTLKGVCANLSFTRLQSAASRLTEILRSEGDGIPAEAAEVMADVRRSYEDTAAAIRAYFNEC